MKYFNIQSINDSIVRIIRSHLRQEHVVGTAGTELARLYFPQGKWLITPEVIMEGTRKKPDITIEAYKFKTEFNDRFNFHCFIEFKSLVNSSIPNALDQLHDTVYIALDHIGFTSGNFSTFMIAIKGVRIAFYSYHNFSSLLDDYGIPNYKGFIPLNYRIDKNKFLEINENFALKEALYERYAKNVFFETDSIILSELGVTGFPKSPHPHVFNLLNINHREHIHAMFSYVASNTANIVS